MNIKLSFVALMASMSLCASAITVTSTPGNLSSAVGDNIGEASLVVSGEINAADFEFIAEKMTSLTSLDLSGASIVAYSGNPILLGRTDYVANSVPAYAFAGTRIESIALPNTLTAIEEGAFSTSRLKSISIPSSVTAIGVGAFSNCDELTSVTIPSTVSSLGSHAFVDCDKLATVELGVTTINASTFARCISLKSVTAVSLAEIGENAFSGCGALEEFAFASSLKTIGNSAFQASGLKSIDFSASESLDSIGAWAFAKCSALTTAVMNDNTSRIGEGAFFDNAALVSFNMPLACTSVASYIFKGNTSIDTTNVLSHNVASIGDYALMDWSHVTSFTLPNSLAYIGNNAFEGWTSLTKLNAEGIVNEVPELGENVWNEVEQANVTLSVTKDLANDFRAADQWKEFTINEVSSVEDILAEDVVNRVSAYFSGFDLIVKADSEIAQVSIYDSSARQYAVETANSDEVVINTSDWDCHLYIVKVILADGSVATIKIAR